jgi:Fe-S-cluster-containing dehydrogenase component
VCPTGALHSAAAAGPAKAGLQPVLYEQAACIGCKACLLVCPFGLIRMAPDQRTLLKCDLCAEQAGWEQAGSQQAGADRKATDSFIPACVRACPTHALRFLPLAETEKAKRRRYVQPYAVAFQADYERLQKEQEGE